MNFAEETKIFGHWHGVWYETHRFWLPVVVYHKTKLIKQYFRTLEKLTRVPFKYKLRKHPFEFAETAVILLSRLESLMDLNSPVLVGSKFLCNQPWAMFGKGRIYRNKPKIKFNDFIELGLFYQEYFKGNDRTQFFDFRIAPKLPITMAEKHNTTPHHIVSIALCLLHDLIIHCGPDCEDLYDLFTNDERVSSSKVDLDVWKSIRFKLIGKCGETLKKPHRLRLGQLKRKKVPLQSEVEFKELSNSNNLAVGEVTKPAKQIIVQNYDDCLDCDLVAPEVDASIIELMREHTDLNFPGIPRI